MAARPDGGATLTALQNRDISPKCKISLYFSRLNGTGVHFLVAD
jgi:hypothetical protein